MATHRPPDTQKNKTGTAASDSPSRPPLPTQLARLRIFIKIGLRELVQKNADAVSRALGFVVVLVSAGLTNVLVLLGTIILAFFSFDWSNFFFPGVEILNLTPLGKFFLSTFPLVLGTTLYALFLFTKSFKSFWSNAGAFVIFFLLALWLGGVLGVNGLNVGLTDLLPAPRPGAPYTLVDLASALMGGIITLFWTKYGVYRFVVSLLAGVVLAWALTFTPSTSTSAPQPDG